MQLRSNEPFWLIKNGLLHTYPSLQHKVKCQVLVVGGGITGALMAHACMDAGYDTILIDKREIANGSTSATTSMLQYEIDVPLHQLIPLVGVFGAEGAYKGCRDAIARIGELTQIIGHNCGYEPKKSLYFCEDEQGLSMLNREFTARKEAELKVEWLDEGAIYSMYGLKALGGILSHDGASIDAFQLAHHLLQWNVSRGLRVYDRTELKQVAQSGSNHEVETHNDCTITANHLVYCTGYETQSMITEHVVSLKNTYACVSEAQISLYEPVFDTLFWNTNSPYLYFRTTEDRRLLIGGGDNHFKDLKHRDDYLDNMESYLIDAAEKHFPGLKFISDYRWGGTFGETSDGLPYIGLYPKTPNTYFVLGFGGNGILFSVMGMDIIKAALRNEEHAMAHYFRFSR